MRIRTTESRAHCPATRFSTGLGSAKSQLTTERLGLLSLETQTQPSSPTYRETPGRPGHRPTQSWVSPKEGKRMKALSPRMPYSPPPPASTWKGLLAKCDSLHVDIQGHRREATRTLSSRKEAWTKAKAYIDDLNHKTAWRHSRRYLHTKTQIERKLLRSEHPDQARDREIILRTVSPSVERDGKKPFVTIEFLTPNRLRSLSQVSMREFGRIPLSRKEITTNLDRLNHPGIDRGLKSIPESQLLPSGIPSLHVIPSLPSNPVLPANSSLSTNPIFPRNLTPPSKPLPSSSTPTPSKPPSATGKPLLTSAIHEFVMKQQRRLSRNSLFFMNLQRKLEIADVAAATARANTQNKAAGAEGKLESQRDVGAEKKAGEEKRVLKLFSQTIVLDQLVKARIVKMQRTELLS